MILMKTSLAYDLPKYFPQQRGTVYNISMKYGLRCKKVLMGVNIAHPN